MAGVDQVENVSFMHNFTCHFHMSHQNKISLCWCKDEKQLMSSTRESYKTLDKKDDCCKFRISPMWRWVRSLQDNSCRLGMLTGWMIDGQKKEFKNRALKVKVKRWRPKHSRRNGAEEVMEAQNLLQTTVEIKKDWKLTTEGGWWLQKSIT